MFSDYFGIYAQGLMKVILEKLKEFILKARASLPISDLNNLLPNINTSCFHFHYSSGFWHSNLQEQIQRMKTFELLKSQSISYASVCLLYQPRLYLLSQKLYHMSTVIHFSKLLVSILFLSSNSAESLLKVIKKKFILALQEE